MVEYKALVKSMQIAMEVRATDLRINSDSQLVVNQIKRVCQAKDLIMQKYLGRVWELERELNEQGIIVRYEWIPWDEIEEPDLLSKLSAEELEQFPDELYVQQIGIPTFEKSASIIKTNEERSWMSPFIEYLKIGKLFEDSVKARIIVVKAANYQVARGTLYGREKSNP